MSNSFATPWTIAHQAPLSMGFPRQEYWRELPFPSPGDPPNAGIKTASPVGFFTWEAQNNKCNLINNIILESSLYLEGDIEILSERKI